MAAHNNQGYLGVVPIATGHGHIIPAEGCPGQCMLLYELTMNQLTKHHCFFEHVVWCFDKLGSSALQV